MSIVFKYLEKMGHFDVFLTVDEFGRPPGSAFPDKNGYWFVSDDLCSANYVSSIGQTCLCLSEMHLNPETMIVKNIGVFDDESRIFLFVKVPEPVLFIGNEEKWESIALDSLYFHTTVFDVFSPGCDRFCVVSREGYSVHDLSLKCVCDYRARIVKWCYDQDVIAFGSDRSVSIHQIRETKINQLFDDPMNSVGFPDKILVNTEIVILIQVNNGVTTAKMSQYNGEERLLVFGMLDRELWRGVRHVSLFDTTSMIVSTEEDTLLVDIAGDPVLVIGSLGLSKAVYIGDGMIFNDSVCRRVVENFDALIQSGKDVLAFCVALMRRKNGLNTAMVFLTGVCGRVKHTDALDTFVRQLAPYAKTPEAQMRLARTIQVCGQTNPHLVIRALVALWDVKGDSLVDQARLPLIEILCRDDCKYLINSVLLAWKGKVKLNGFCVREFIKRLGSDVHINPRVVRDVTDMVSAFIEFGRKDEAKQLLLKCIIDDRIPPGKIAGTIDEYVLAFGMPENLGFVEIAQNLKRRTKKRRGGRCSQKTDA